MKKKKGKSHSKDKYEGAEYNAQYDAYYRPETGEWIESQCGDFECEYCGLRPAYATPTTDSNIDKRLAAWHDSKVATGPLIETLGLTWEQYAQWAKTNKLP